MATRFSLSAALGAAALLAGCASTPAPQIATAPPPPPPPRGEQPPEQAAVIAPRAYCPGPGFEAAARQNVVSIHGLEFAPFGRPEHGWEIYAPGIAQEISSECPPETAQFAARLAAWQGRRGLPSSGVMDAGSFSALKNAMQGHRPFLKMRSEGLCPDSPEDDGLAQLSPTESRWDKPVRLRPGALGAYRRMVAEAKREVPQISVEPELLRIFSAYRSPESDGARCATEGNCNGLVRAACSAHRTGLAMDINVGHAPGFGADSTADGNRLYQSRTAVYRWMVANAGRFGFVNYPFEPWHWEWTGEIMTASGSARPARPEPEGETPSPAGRVYARVGAPAPSVIASGLAYARPTQAARSAPALSQAESDPIGALLTRTQEAGEGPPPTSARTFARSWSAEPDPPRPSSPAALSPPSW